MVFLSGLLIAKTGYPALHIFTSSVPLSMAGAGYLYSSPISSKMNPSYHSEKSFSASLIKYPASITSQSAGAQLPLLNGNLSVSINFISYGIFQGYTDYAEPTGTYSSSDSWLGASYSTQVLFSPIYWGVQSKFYSSLYNKSRIRLATLSTGVHLKLRKYKANLGISIHDFGKQFKGYKLDISPQVLLSISKELINLPLTLYFDFIPYNDNQNSEIFIGGNFNIGKDFQLRAGSSTRKVEHNIKRGMTQSILGSTGMGFGYKNKSVFLHYGFYIYGTTAFIQGLEIGTYL
tara:strand:+ start:469 stop:1338 length:870 start_codon:yes stop_codon:yes gene_type:complete